jgi:hypothetical protein
MTHVNGVEAGFQKNFVASFAQFLKWQNQKKFKQILQRQTMMQ